MDQLWVYARYFDSKSSIWVLSINHYFVTCRFIIQDNQFFHLHSSALALLIIHQLLSGYSGLPLALVKTISLDDKLLCLGVGRKYPKHLLNILQNKFIWYLLYTCKLLYICIENKYPSKQHIELLQWTCSRRYRQSLNFL